MAQLDAAVQSMVWGGDVTGLPTARGTLHVCMYVCMYDYIADDHVDVSVGMPCMPKPLRPRGGRCPHSLSAHCVLCAFHVASSEHTSSALLLVLVAATCRMHVTPQQAVQAEAQADLLRDPRTASAEAY